MDLSIIIVNYNVKFFLEQCIKSVQMACANIDAEVIVVDNNSNDGSVQLMQEKFPDILLIDNKENLGFSKANNQAIKIAKGEFVLLLNPDTVVQEDTFEKCISFARENQSCGTLGVKMIDGKGMFLPESKRGLPTPEVAFYKMFGLSTIFPNSKKFGQYHLSYLDKDEIHQVDVISGAYMFMRKKALDKVGLLDEEFFMYGEDIDLSFRIQKGGYENYYYPNTSIIHYKGESTKKGSLNYVITFYNAMIIFAKKHFSGSNIGWYLLLINFAIYFRAAIAIFGQFFNKYALVLIDVFMSISGLFLLKSINEYRGIIYDDRYVFTGFLCYTLIWVLFIFLFGGYDKPIKVQKTIKGILYGAIFVILVYLVLPESLKFSRVFVILGPLILMALSSLVRYLFHKLNVSGFEIVSESKRFAIIGSGEEVDKVSSFLNSMVSKPETIVAVSVNTEDIHSNSTFMGNKEQIKEIVDIFNIHEVIFCANDLGSKDIIGIMSKLVKERLDYKISSKNASFIIGSNSILTAGQVFLFELKSLFEPGPKRSKKTFDLMSSILFILLAPILIWMQYKPLKFLKNCLSVLIGSKTWVGYNKGISGIEEFPKLTPGILTIAEEESSSELLSQINEQYAKNYSVINDLKIALRHIRNLGR
jgi:GT2 family glycosyltransferase